MNKYYLLGNVNNVTNKVTRSCFKIIEYDIKHPHYIRNF